MHTAFIILIDDICVILNAKRILGLASQFKANQCGFESVELGSSFTAILNAAVHRQQFRIKNALMEIQLLLP